MIHDDEGVPGLFGRTTRGGPQETECPVFLPLDDLPQRTLLMLLLLAREAELTAGQVDSPRSRALVRRGLTGGARVSRRAVRPAGPPTPRAAASGCARPPGGWPAA